MVKKFECVTDSRTAKSQTVAFEESPDTYAPMMQGNGRTKASLGQILFVEDHEDTRELVTYVLATNNYKIVAVANCDDALMQARSSEFDLYLIDNWIPDCSGIDLCHRLREFDSLTPIL